MSKEHQQDEVQMKGSDLKDKFRSSKTAKLTRLFQLLFFLSIEGHLFTLSTNFKET